MASERRIEKINILLAEEVAKILDKEIEFPQEFLVTVTRASASPDLNYAVLSISVLGKNEEKDAETALEIIGKNIYHIQKRLNRKLRMRPVPKISFALDSGEIKREGVEKTLSELKSGKIA